MAEVPLEINATGSPIFNNSGIISEIDVNCEQCRFTWFNKDRNLIQPYIFLYKN